MTQLEEQILRISSNGNLVDASCSSHVKDAVRKSFCVGCALLPKKVSRYLTPKMMQVAQLRGVELVPIDIEKPLEEQGHFDAIIHKLRPNKEWEQNLHNYTLLHPDVKVIDKVDSIRNLQNRSTMLRPLQGAGVHIQGPSCHHRHCPSVVAHVQAPAQVEISEGMSAAEAETQLAAAGLYPPLLVKPVWTDGRKGSHGLAVLHDLGMLTSLLEGKVSAELKPPLVVQQFVDHGGVIYKVYVLGGRVVTCRRPSLGPQHLDDEAQRQGVISLPRISCKSSYPSNSAEAKFSAGVIDNRFHGRTNACCAADELAASSGVEGAGRGGGHVGRGPGNGAGDAKSASVSLPSPGLQIPDLSARGRGGEPAQPASPSSLLVMPFGSSSSVADAVSSPSPVAKVPAAVSPPGGSLVHTCPPNWVTDGLAAALRQRLGMQLFNFDMICPMEVGGVGLRRGSSTGGAGRDVQVPELSLGEVEKGDGAASLRSGAESAGTDETTTAIRRGSLTTPLRGGAVGEGEGEDLLQGPSGQSTRVVKDVHTNGERSGSAPSSSVAASAAQTHTHTHVHGSANPSLYYVIDINYFPGVDKIPEFEKVFCDFLVAACLGIDAPAAMSPRAPGPSPPCPIPAGASSGKSGSAARARKTGGAAGGLGLDLDFALEEEGGKRAGLPPNIAASPRAGTGVLHPNASSSLPSLSSSSAAVAEGADKGRRRPEGLLLQMPGVLFA